MVGGFLAFLEDIGHAVGVAHLDEPIAQCRCNAVVNAVEAASLPWGDDLLFLLFALHIDYLVAAHAKTDLWPDAQSRDFGFVLVVFVPFAKVDVKQQRHIDIMGLLKITNGVEDFVIAFLRTRSLP